MRRTLPSTVSADLAYKFQCTQNQGAMLVLADPAKKTHARNTLDFKRYMMEHHDRWHEFATQTVRLDCKPEDIVLVRGTVKTGTWAVAAYLEGENSSREVSFHVSSNPVATIGFEWSSEIQERGNFEWRSSSAKIRQATEPTTNTAALLSSSGTPMENELPEVVVTQGRTQSVIGIEYGRPPAAADTQCIFLQYFKMKRRPVIGWRKIEAAAGPSQFPPHEDNGLDDAAADSGSYHCDNTVEEMPCGTQACHHATPSHAYSLLTSGSAF